MAVITRTQRNKSTANLFLAQIERCHHISMAAISIHKERSKVKVSVNPTNFFHKSIETMQVNDML